MPCERAARDGKRFLTASVDSHGAALPGLPPALAWPAHFESRDVDAVYGDGILRGADGRLATSSGTRSRHPGRGARDSRLGPIAARRGRRRSTSTPAGAVRYEYHDGVRGAPPCVACDRSPAEHAGVGTDIGAELGGERIRFAGASELGTAARRSRV